MYEGEAGVCGGGGGVCSLLVLDFPLLSLYELDVSVELPFIFCK